MFERVSAVSIKDVFYGVRKTAQILFDGVLFENLHCTETAVLLISMHSANGVANVNVGNSMFRNTTAAMALSIQDSNVPVKKGVIKIYNITFLDVNEVFGSQWQSLLSLNNGKFHIASCRFINSTAANNPYDALVRITVRAEVTMKDCYFESRTMSTQLFADENSWVSLERNNIINVEASTRQEGTVFSCIPGNAKQLRITGTFKILCPPGFASLLSSIVIKQKA